MATIARQLEQEYPNTNSGNSAPRPHSLKSSSAVRDRCCRAARRGHHHVVDRLRGLANLMLARAPVARGDGSPPIAQLAGESARPNATGACCSRSWRRDRHRARLRRLWALVALLPPNQPRIHVIAIDWRVLLMAASASITTGILFG